MAREYSDARFARVHRLTVDCYAVQHPGEPTPPAIRSVALHLMSLCAVLERGLDPGAATRLLQVAAEASIDFTPLDPPAEPGAITVEDIVAATTPGDHEEAVRAWSDSVWSAWSAHHARVRDWLDAALDARSVSSEP